VTPPPKQAPDREPKIAGQIVGLIEPAAHRPQRVERHWNNCVGALQHLSARLDHQASQRLGQGPPMFVLERVDDLAQRAVMAPRTPGE
jgi:hypothetical protein